ncbi:MAG: hypothetical protein ACOZF2_17070 [Thermodesulfobacteriota bacterium]
MANGGRILAGIPCIEERTIGPEDLVVGAELCKAEKVVLEVTGAKATVVY